MLEYLLILVVAFGCTALRRSLIPLPQLIVDHSDESDESNREVNSEEAEEVIGRVERNKVGGENGSTKREEWANRTVSLLHAMLLVAVGTIAIFVNEGWCTDFHRLIFSLAVGYFVYDSVLQFFAAAKSPLKSLATITHHVISTFILAGHFFIPTNVACQIFCIGEWAVVFIAVLWRVRQQSQSQFSNQFSNANANSQLIRLLKLLVKFSYCVRMVCFVLGFLCYGVGNVARGLLQVSTYPKLVGIIFIFALNTL